MKKDGHKIFKYHGVSKNIAITDDVLQSQSLSTANSKDILKYKIGNHISKFRLHRTDTGSSAIISKFYYNKTGRMPDNFQTLK